MYFDFYFECLCNWYILIYSVFAARFNTSMSYIAGLNRDGFDRDGYDVDGYNRYGYDKDGYNRWGFNRTGYDRGGKQDTHRIYDLNGFDDQCLDIQGEVPVNY